jgi:hypothetical protein
MASVIIITYTNIPFRISLDDEGRKIKAKEVVAFLRATVEAI